MNYLSDTAKNFPSSGIRKMFELAQKYDNLINLSVGEPNFETPVHIRDAAKKALDEGCTHYCPNAGLNELRELIAQKYNKLIGSNYTYENVIITVGASEALFLSLAATLNIDDEVIIPEPYYPNYEGPIALSHGKIVFVHLDKNNDFKLNPYDIEKAITPKTKVIILNSPNNPLGRFIEESDIKKICEIAKKHNLIILSDEVYDHIMFDENKFFSPAHLEEVREQTIIVNSFSKTFAMTGWRIGFLIANKEIAAAASKLQGGVVSCVPTFIQNAAITALESPMDSSEQMIKDYYRRRDILIDGLNSIKGIKCFKSTSTFYAFANIAAFGQTSEEFCTELLLKAKVVCVPGSAFGESGEGYMRLSFANSDENLKEAVKRIGAFISKEYGNLEL